MRASTPTNCAAPCRGGCPHPPAKHTAPCRGGHWPSAGTRPHARHGSMRASTPTNCTAPVGADAHIRPPNTPHPVGADYISARRAAAIPPRLSLAAPSQGEAFFSPVAVLQLCYKTPGALAFFRRTRYDAGTMIMESYPGSKSNFTRRKTHEELSQSSGSGARRGYPV